MKKILSVDWDYFIGATAEQRALYFPDGGNETLPPTMQKLIWDSRYSSNPEVFRNIGILKRDYYILLDILKRFSFEYLSDHNKVKLSQVLAMISHSWIYQFVINRTDPDEEFEVYNIDFHHDMYHYRTRENEVNCGNWVNCLLEHRPNMKYYWIKREDSETEALGGEVSCSTKTIDDLRDMDFDYVFLCRSDCWSPPHLDSFFSNLWETMVRYMPIEIEKSVRPLRQVDYIDPVLEEFKKQVMLNPTMSEESLAKIYEDM